MTWIDRIENNVFSIKTGDGVTYYPALPIGYETSKEFNAMAFEFINVDGALVNRRRVKARNFPLTFFFTGEDNIDQAEYFDLSANDQRAWVVSHPMYGTITGQPISIKRADANLNATQFSVDFWETITTSNPIAVIAPVEAIQAKITELATISPIEYESKVDIKPADITQIKVQAQSTDDLINKVLPAGSYAAYQAAAYNMFNNIDNMATDAATGISAIQQVLLQPALFALNVNDRLNLLISLFNSAGDLLTDKYTTNNKAYFEAYGAMVISSIILATLTPLPTDYITRDQVVTTSNTISSLYQYYLKTLDDAYVRIGNPGNSFTNGQQTQNDLQDIVLQGLDSLSTLAFNAKVERFVILGTDSQLIPLTHKYLGLDAADKNIETFRTINNLKNGALFLIPKGTEIKYYA